MRQIHPESAPRIDQCLGSVTVDKQSFIITYIKNKTIQISSHRPTQVKRYSGCSYFKIAILINFVCMDIAHIMYKYNLTKMLLVINLLVQQYYNIMKETRNYAAKCQKIEHKQDKVQPIIKQESQSRPELIQIVMPTIAKIQDQQSFEVNQCSSQNYANKQNNIQSNKILPQKSKKIKKKDTNHQSMKRHSVNRIQQNLPQTQNLTFRDTVQNKPIVSTGFGTVLQQDFKIMASKNGWQKSISTVLLNQYGNIIYADRLGSEHFQGSLNNFQRNPFHHMIVQKQRSSILKTLKAIKYGQSTIIKYFIYSKNIKRRYSKVTSDQIYTDHDLFFRYLKGLSTKILPIQITFQNYKNYQGFWNPQLVKNNVPLKCFWLQTRNSLKFPTSALKKLDLGNDYTISKFMKYTLKRQKQNEEQQNKNAQIQAVNFQKQVIKNLVQQEKFRNDEQDFSEAKDSVRHSNMTGKQLFMNSYSKETERER